MYSDNGFAAAAARFLTLGTIGMLHGIRQEVSFLAVVGILTIGLTNNLLVDFHAALF